MECEIITQMPFYAPILIILRLIPLNVVAN